MKISTLGFPQTEESKLGKILPLAKHRQFSLQPFLPQDLPDVLLVFGDADHYSTELNHLPAGHAVKIVTVAKQPPAQDTYYHLPFPLVASRVLRVLDKLSAADGMDSNLVKTKVDEGIKIPEAGQGAAKTELLVGPVIDATSVAVTIPADVIENQTLPQYRVLVVDDSLPMQKALALELEKLAASVHIDFAGSGEEALEQTAVKEYDFIFLDIMMPGIDGFETCSQMRNRPNMKKLPIIMLSAKTSPMDEVKGVISGCTTYLVKPIVHEEFQKVMQRITKWVDNFTLRGQVAGN
ncbi:MAG: response regulator [Methylovulum sp.]|uniref:response regulator n=1 Tax=Methylovulum sp. TaxID=1916980 RepID=UPI00262B0FA2|nr:response regulator [Methylovulum sp.]MDD2722825.1 response regulator [Methylovulum sp.]MDD5124413.1 response regulator [Methylovulum sp.]